MDNNYLAHHGIKGQKWYVRRFQNEDGSLTPAGRSRYDVGPPREGARAVIKTKIGNMQKAMSDQRAKSKERKEENKIKKAERKEEKKIQRAEQKEAKKELKEQKRIEKDEKEKEEIMKSGDITKILENQHRFTDQELSTAVARAQRNRQLRSLEEQEAQERVDRFLAGTNRMLDRGMKALDTYEKIQKGISKFKDLRDHFDDLSLTEKLARLRSDDLDADQTEKLWKQMNNVKQIADAFGQKSFKKFFGDDDDDVSSQLEGKSYKELMKMASDPNTSGELLDAINEKAKKYGSIGENIGKMDTQAEKIIGKKPEGDTDNQNGSNNENQTGENKQMTRAEKKAAKKKEAEEKAKREKEAAETIHKLVEEKKAAKEAAEKKAKESAEKRAKEAEEKKAEEESKTENKTESTNTNDDQKVNGWNQKEEARVNQSISNINDIYRRLNSSKKVTSKEAKEASKQATLDAIAKLQGINKQLESESKSIANAKADRAAKEQHDDMYRQMESNMNAKAREVTESAAKSQHDAYLNDVSTRQNIIAGQKAAISMLQMLSNAALNYNSDD